MQLCGKEKRMDDLIKRQDAINSIESHIRTGDELYPITETDKILNHAFEISASCIYNMPSAEPVQKTGKWITGAELNGKGIIPPTTTDYRLLGCRKREFWTNFLYCSVCYKDAYCDTDYGFQLFDFCPFCGASMRGEEE